MTSKLEDLQKEIQSIEKDWGAIDVLKFCLDKYENRIAFASSLGLEDQVLTDIIKTHNSKSRIFTLDTGRLYQESYALIEKINTTYNTKIEVFFPRHDSVEKLVNNKGMYSFFESIENRKECCAIRKLEPLSRALQDLDMWITGIRRNQSITRLHMQLLEWDERNNILKLNPLIEWTEEQIWDYIKEHNVPYNSLHEKGFPSIGCAPCTRAIIGKGDDIRSGRWWWENPEHKECGLHINRK